MLVLTRKQDETIHIGNDIVIKVISTGRGKIKIGIEAPSHVRVRRGELTETVSLSRQLVSRKSSDMALRTVQPVT